MQIDANVFSDGDFARKINSKIRLKILLIFFTECYDPIILTGFCQVRASSMISPFFKPFNSLSTSLGKLLSFKFFTSGLSKQVNDYCMVGGGEWRQSSKTPKT